MIIPNYRQNNLINLLSAVIAGCGGKNPYPVLDTALVQEIQNATNVVFFLIDGLGADSVQKTDKQSIFRTQYQRTLNTVFPSTTAAAITAVYTGRTPLEHGATAWYMNMKEFGSVVALLPFHTKQGEPLTMLKERPLQFPPSLFSQISSPSHVIL